MGPAWIVRRVALRLSTRLSVVLVYPESIRRVALGVWRADPDIIRIRRERPRVPLAVQETTHLCLLALATLLFGALAI